MIQQLPYDIFNTYIFPYLGIRGTYNVSRTSIMFLKYYIEYRKKLIKQYEDFDVDIVYMLEAKLEKKYNVFNTFHWGMSCCPSCNRYALDEDILHRHRTFIDSITCDLCDKDVCNWCKGASPCIQCNKNLCEKCLMKTHSIAKCICKSKNWNFDNLKLICNDTGVKCRNCILEYIGGI